MDADVEQTDLLILGITALVGILGIAILLFWWWWPRRPPRDSASAKGSTLEHDCENCGRKMIFARNDLGDLSPGEIGLAVRAMPECIGRKLADYDCPYCGASHCFAVDRKSPEYIGCDLYTPQTGSGRCLDCRTPLGTPPWPEGAFDGRLDEAPELRPNFGLICDRCSAVCCVACCEKATRGRTKDGSLLCPRCFRGPLTKVYNP